MAKELKTKARLLFEAMERLTPPKDWTPELQREFGDLTHADVLAELLEPVRARHNPKGDLFCTYIAGTGFVDFKFTPAGQLVGAHRG